MDQEYTIKIRGGGISVYDSVGDQLPLSAGICDDYYLIPDGSFEYDRWIEAKLALKILMAYGRQEGKQSIYIYVDTFEPMADRVSNDLLALGASMKPVDKRFYQFVIPCD